MNAQRALNFDITAGRHKGNSNSAAAFERVRPTRPDKYMAILSYMQARRTMGLYVNLKTVSAHLAIPYTSASARLSEMKALKLIKETGERIDGCAVLVPEYSK